MEGGGRQKQRERQKQRQREYAREAIMLSYLQVDDYFAHVLVWVTQ